ncbi:unnamed protein product [Oppiella nova]|uniref:Alpha-carbonic anhydrase domain-containing protein n=1 Tax=Oppiella nova TaxID=334625 RepID=A0A7R9LJV1_9ACAR|nr:unnamed protein product [Oppiella nova]CAG2164349.1 unnamed protein product [Oppiella nova]
MSFRPDFWGRLNPKWSHCNKGRRQSPIDINPELLLYDPGLLPVHINGDHVSGKLVNTGRSITFKINVEQSVVLSSGPLSYQYTLSNITLHFGRENNRGSEHTISGVQFPGEIQLYAYNSQLYSNWTEARHEANGLAAISVLIAFSKNSNQANTQLKHITHALKNITHRGDSQWLSALSIVELLPTIKHYITYEGSLTQPACHETVQWIVLNKPIYMSSHQFYLLRHTLKSDGHGDNYRPTQPLNHRSLRSNIYNANQETNDVKVEEIGENSYKKISCSMERSMTYKANIRVNEEV